MLRNVDLRSSLLQEFDLDNQSIEKFLEKVRVSYGLQGVIFFCPTNPNHHASKLTQRPWRVSKDEKKTSWLAALRRMTRVAWSQTKTRTIPIPFLLAGAGGSRQFVRIPVHSKHGVWAFLIATSNESDSDWDERQLQLVKDLRHIAQHMHKRIAGIMAGVDDIDFSNVTQREAEALSLASEGKNGGEIASAMGISQETSREHLDSARRKLKALNRTQAVVKALKAGLI